MASLVATVAGAWRQIPAAERRRSAIFTSNYGEAGATDVLGSALALPRAYSGHSGFSEWGEPAARDTHALVIGYAIAADAAPAFAGRRTLARVDDRVGLDNGEQRACR